MPRQRQNCDETDAVATTGGGREHSLYGDELSLSLEAILNAVSGAIILHQEFDGGNIFAWSLIGCVDLLMSGEDVDDG
jgi:hypothetical protein